MKILWDIIKVVFFIAALVVLIAALVVLIYFTLRILYQAFLLVWGCAFFYFLYQLHVLFSDDEEISDDEEKARRKKRKDAKKRKERGHFGGSGFGFSDDFDENRPTGDNDSIGLDEIIRRSDR